jgi:hypothetical protein
MEVAIMHPAGIKFGLAHGLLEFSGGAVTLSPPLLESISEMARRKVRRRKRVIGIWEEAVAAGLRKMLFEIDAPRQEYVPFYTGLDRVIFETMGPIAEKAKIAERYGRHFSSEHTFYRKFRQDIRRPHMRLEAGPSWRLLFRESLGLIKQLLAEYSPEDMRHAELLALCQLDNWDRSPNKLTIEDFL